MTFVNGFKRGSRGFLIQRLQKHLGGLQADSDFGGKTEARIREFQKENSLEQTGTADTSTWQALGLQSPSLFELCLNLSGEFEGTGFGGINRTDIDGAGVTLGIAGFTTKHGEVQELLRAYFAAKPDAINTLNPFYASALKNVVYNPKASVQTWNDFFYRVGRVPEQIVSAVREWGQDETFQKIQMDMTKKTMWEPTVATVHGLGLRSDQALAIIFDTYVQNGGFRPAHRKAYEAQKLCCEHLKITRIARVVAEAANPKWQKDVLIRKSTIAVGTGTVHGRTYNLANYGFNLLKQ